MLMDKLQAIIAIEAEADYVDFTLIDTEVLRLQLERLYVETL